MNLYLIFNLYLIKQTHLQWHLTASMGEKKILKEQLEWTDQNETDWPKYDYL